CTGQAPFAGNATVAVLYKVCEEQPKPIPEINPAVPDWLDAVVAKLHAKRPDDRFQTAAEGAEPLGPYLAHGGQPARVPQPRAPARPAPPQATAAVPVQRPSGFEYRSKRTLWGWPLVHLAWGIDPQTGRKRVARGIIAIGDLAIGGFALGGVA